MQPIVIIIKEIAISIKSNSKSIISYGNHYNNNKRNCNQLQEDHEKYYKLCEGHIHKYAYTFGTSQKMQNV